MPRFAAIRNGWVVGILDALDVPTVGVALGLTFLDVTNLPQVTPGSWRYDGVCFSGVDMTDQKQQFLTAMQAQMTEIGQVIEKTKSLISAFQDRGYDAAASNPITDADLASFGVVQYDLGIAINLFQQLQALMAGQATAPTLAYESAVSKWRTL